MEYLGIVSNGTFFNDPAYGIVTTMPSCFGANPLGTSKTRAVFYVAYGGTWWDLYIATRLMIAFRRIYTSYKAKTH
jgi:hypothetical protein